MVQKLTPANKAYGFASIVSPALGVTNKNLVQLSYRKGTRSSDVLVNTAEGRNLNPFVHGPSDGSTSNPFETQHESAQSRAQRRGNRNRRTAADKRKTSGGGAPSSRPSLLPPWRRGATLVAQVKCGLLQGSIVRLIL